METAGCGSTEAVRRASPSSGRCASGNSPTTCAQPWTSWYGNWPPPTADAPVSMVMASARVGTANFPSGSIMTPARLDVQLCGVGTAARAYIESVQPPRRPGRLNSLNGNRIGRGLGVLRDICNRDKHQTLLRASVRWTGEWPVALGGDPPCRAPRAKERTHLDTGSGKTVETVGHELRYGEALLITTGWPDGQRLEFPVDAYFDHLTYSRAGTRRAASVAETLDACMDSVEIVVSRLREEL